LTALACLERSKVVLDQLVRLPKEFFARVMASFEVNDTRLVDDAVFTDKKLSRQGSASQGSANQGLESNEFGSKLPELGSFACRILVVGEQVEIAEHPAVGLSDFGHQVFVTSGEPRQLISQMGACLPAVVIIQTAPGVSGFLAACSLASCIRAVPYVAQPLIFICSSVEDGICRQEAQGSGVDYFLKIPSTCADMARLVRQTILQPRRTFTTGQSAAV
jgi:hypothetical protein